MLENRDMVWLNKLRSAADEGWGALSTWEQRFIEDILEKYNQYGARLSLSKKQWLVIADISEKLGL